MNWRLGVMNINVHLAPSWYQPCCEESRRLVFHSFERPSDEELALNSGLTDLVCGRRDELGPTPTVAQRIHLERSTERKQSFALNVRFLLAAHSSSRLQRMAPFRPKCKVLEVILHSQHLGTSIIWKALSLQ